MTQITICDDNIQEAEAAKELLQKYFADRGDYSLNVSVYSSSKALLSALKEGEQSSVFLLDILMPDESGIELGREIRGLLPSALIIYLTSSPDFALDAFHVYAFQYILKPVVPETLYPVLDRALSVLNSGTGGSYLLKTREGIISLEYSRIQHIEYLNHTIRVHMTDGAVHVSTTLRVKFDEVIREPAELPFFIKPHKSYLINMNHVLALQERDFIMRDLCHIPISRINYAQAKKEYIDFILNKGSGGTNGCL